MNRALRAYKSVAGSALTGREADAEVFRILIRKLTSVEHSTDSQKRRHVLAMNNRLWNLIQKANADDNGTVPKEDRLLFIRMANEAQRYGIRAILDCDVPIGPLLECAKNVLEGLTTYPEAGKRDGVIIDAEPLKFDGSDGML
ncbi:flagellar biosynthesis regulator FlaF [Acetobacter persici]|uniref:flagellar biosynthesis regulator FlaF n=1 Tax=Acetobacter persici TaxID=1076596 RepID=UPI00098D6F8A|nr:flagellar biosynthesis regulator FlaF [Acetobacter persici]